MATAADSTGFSEGSNGPLPVPRETPPASPSLQPLQPPSTPVSLEAQRTPLEEYRQVGPLISAPLAAGASYYLINRRWFVEWLQWVGHPDTQSPKMRPLPDPLPLGAEVYGGGSPSSALSPPQLAGLQQPPASPAGGLAGVAGVAGGAMDAPTSSAAKRTRTHSWTKDRPGPIDNAELLDGTGSALLRKTISELSDYQLVSEDAWNLLSKWYGGGPAVKRRAIQLPTGGVQVELHGLQLKVFKSSDTNGTPLEVIESKNTSVKDFKASVCRELSLDPEKIRIWDFFNQKNYALLEKTAEKTLEACRIFDQNPILLEEQRADGSWVYSDDDATDGAGDVNTGGGFSNGMGLSTAADVPSVGEPLQRGAVGLQNLGNTCFMNSSLQCLSNIPPLREFFLTDEYRTTLNRAAYKTKGKLAESFAALLSLMWREDTTRVAPRNFKWQVGQFAEQFSGYGQQDSMELIEYVLDGLKEDCNLVRGSKPYIEVKEADGRSDEEVAVEALDNHRLRSNSKVDDLFVGLFKSVVRCPELEERCGRASVTFDPFLSAKLPLVTTAEQRMTTIPLSYVRDTCPPNCEPCFHVRVKVSKDQSVKELIEAAAKEVEGLRPQHCILVEIWNKKVHKFLEDSEAIEHIRPDDDLMLFEVSEPKAFQISTEQRWGSPTTYRISSSLEAEAAESPAQGQELCGAIILHRQASKSSSSYSWSSSYTSREIRGLPMLLAVPKQATARELCQQVGRKLRDNIVEPGATMPGWKLLRVDKYSPTSDGTAVDPDSDEVVELKESREHFAVEWHEDSPLPARLERDEARGHATGGQRGDGEQELTTLLKMFVEEEKLGADDAWYCNKCKEHKEAFKKLEFHRTPPVLVLQLKRFQFTRWSRERLNNPVSFPLEGLDLSQYCTESSLRADNADPAKTTYDLAGLCKHIGSLGGGHYVAYCRSSEDGEWYNFDDGSVQRVSAQTVQEDKVGAYVLFYIRRDQRPSSYGPPLASP